MNKRPLNAITIEMNESTPTEREREKEERRPVPIRGVAL